MFLRLYLQKYQTIYQASNDAEHLSVLNASSDHEPKNNTTVQHFNDHSFKRYHLIKKKLS